MLRVQLLDNQARAPIRATGGAAGYDLVSVEGVTIEAGDRALIRTGLAIAVPPGTYGRIAPRSGLAVKHGIATAAGVIDADYTGEVKVLLMNHGKEAFSVTSGDRIAQLVLERIETPPVEVVDRLDNTERGAGGFGSTGV